MSASPIVADEDHRYHDLVRTFYEGIEYDHPDNITSDGQGHRFCYHCGWSASCVKYYTYNGPSVNKI